MATHEPPSDSQQKKRRGLWVALSLIGGALILILIGVVTVLVVSNHTATKAPPGTDKTPQEALTAYATDLKQGNYHDAYNHLSTDYKHIFNTNPTTEEAYTAAESAVINRRGGIKTFTLGNVFMTDVGNGSSSSGAKGYIDYSYADGSQARVFFLLSLEGSHWKILSVTQ